MSKNVKILNIITNSLIFLMMITGVLLMFFNRDPNQALTESSWEAFKFYTVQSNVIMGIASLISLINLFLNKKDPLWQTLFKYISTVAVTVTFLTVMFYLGPLYGYLALLQNANLFMHLLIPVLAIAHYILLEPKVEQFKFKYTPLAISTTALYGIGYMINVVVTNGYGTLKNDWYGFASQGLGIGILVYFMMQIFTYLFAIGLYFAYRYCKIKALHE